MGIFTKEKTVNHVILVDINKIIPNPAQPRITFEDSELSNLAQSIRENGLLQPLTVRKDGDDYILIAGERRLRALKLNNQAFAPVIIVNIDAKQSAILALIENMQRQNLNFFEEATALRNLIVELKISQQELASRLGKSQSTIANKLRLLKYDTAVANKMISVGFNERQARALLCLDSCMLDSAIDVIAAKGYNVEQTERYVDLVLKDRPLKLKPRSMPIVRDVRLFFNTITNAVAVMNKSGINATAKRVDSEDSIEYVINIPISHRR